MLALYEQKQIMQTSCVHNKQHSCFYESICPSVRPYSRPYVESITASDSEMNIVTENLIQYKALLKMLEKN